ncbi:MAG: hypothetical protein R2751_19415 [Bacteroidales bacterium]
MGLNALAQWTASLDPVMPQGLGTGQIYANSLPSPRCTSAEGPGTLVPAPGGLGPHLLMTHG